MLTNGMCRGTGHSLMASVSPSDGTISMKMPTINSLQKTVRLASHQFELKSNITHALLVALNMRDQHTLHNVVQKMCRQWLCYLFSRCVVVVNVDTETLVMLFTFLILRIRVPGSVKRGSLALSMCRILNFGKA